MPSEQDLIGALRRADAAGDTQGAQRIAQLIKDQRAGGSAQPPAPQLSPQERARQAGQEVGAGQSGALAALRGYGNTATFGAGDYVTAAMRYAGQRLTGVQNPDDFSTDVAYARGADEGAQAQHPVLSTAGSVAGALAPGSVLAKAGLKVAPRAVQAALTLKAGEPVANMLRLVGNGAIGGGAYGTAAGGAQAAENGGTAGDVATGAAVGGGEGAVAGAVLGPLGAGAVKGVQVVAKQFKPVAQRAIQVLADKLDMHPDTLATMMHDFRATTQRAPTIADVLQAKDAANLEPITTQHQSGAADMLEAQQANQAALPGRLGQQIANSQPTATPFGGARAATSRVGDLRSEQDRLMSDVMGNKTDPGALRNQPVLLGQQEADLLAHPLVRDAVRGDIPLRQKLASQEPLTVDDFERLRQALRGQQTARMSPNSPRYSPQAAGDYGQTADMLSQMAAAQHPDYGDALAAYGAQERFINAFQHASSGKSLLDTPDMGDIRSFNTPEGRAGLELGARTRLVQTARESEGNALKAADQLRQGAPTRSMESLPAAEQARLQRVGAAETQSQQNYADLAPGRLSSRDKEIANTTKSAGEAAVATVGHTLTGFKFHAIGRILLQRGVRESTAREIVAQVTRARTPADIDQLKTMLNNARVGADARRLILKNAARRGGAGGAALANQYLGQ